MFYRTKKNWDLFRDCTVVHPHLKRAYEEFRDAVNNPGGASVIFLFGPTGVGKTTLLRQIMKVMISEKTARLKRDSNFLPVATTEAPKGFDSSYNGGSLRNGLSHRAPESGSFDWKVYYQSVLASLSESSASDYSIPNRSKLKKSKSDQLKVKKHFNLSRGSYLYCVKN